MLEINQREVYDKCVGASCLTGEQGLCVDWAPTVGTCLGPANHLPLQPWSFDGCHLQRKQPTCPQMNLISLIPKQLTGNNRCTVIPPTNHPPPPQHTHMYYTQEGQLTNQNTQVTTTGTATGISVDTTDGCAPDHKTAKSWWRPGLSRCRSTKDLFSYLRTPYFFSTNFLLPPHFTGFTFEVCFNRLKTLTPNRNLEQTRNFSSTVREMKLAQLLFKMFSRRRSKLQAVT